MSEKLMEEMKMRITSEEQARRVEEKIAAKIRKEHLRPEHRITAEGLIRALIRLWEAHMWTAATVLMDFYGVTHEDFYP